MDLRCNTYASGPDDSWVVPSTYGHVNRQPGRPNGGTYYGGEAMQHTNSGMSNYSNHSDYSSISHGSSSSQATSTTQGTSYGSWDPPWSPTFNSGIAGAGYSRAGYSLEGIDHGYGQLNSENMPEVSPVFLGQPKHTPSSLGWSLDTEYLERYKLVYHKASPSYLCLELRPKEEVSPETPKTVYLDVDLNSQDGHRCMYPNSCGSTFRRPADLERHYADVHDAEGLKKEFYCSYSQCNRSFKQINEMCTSSKKAFGRKDHYRDHLRDNHKEDVGAARKPGDFKEPKKYKEYQEARKRKLDPDKWRCCKGLHTVRVAKYGWICPICNEHCDNDRIKARREKEMEEKFQLPSQQPFDHYADCTFCNGHGTIAYGQESVPCSNCQQYMDEQYENYPTQTSQWHDLDSI